jgi:hypothetical protein
MRHPRAAWTLVVAFATVVWLVPFLVVWSTHQDPRRALRQAARQAPPAPGRALAPLILYAESWPTRAAVKLEEIQGATQESDVILGPKIIAGDVALALRDLGIVSEPRRLESIADDATLLAQRDIVLVYPVRHGRPPPEVMQFIDRRLEPLYAGQDPGLKRLRFHDVAIAELPAPAGEAQAALGSALRYYAFDYHAGPVLVEAMTSITIYKTLQALAAGLSGDQPPAPEPAP